MEKISCTLEEAAEATGFSVSTLRRAVLTTDPAAFPPPLQGFRAGNKGTWYTRPEYARAWVQAIEDARW